MPNKADVVVATGEEAKFFSAKFSADDVKLTFERKVEPGNLADQGPSGKTPPEQSPTESMEATFSKILAEHLFAQVHSGKIQSLILIADPETLGEMRPLLHSEVQDALVMELDKTLINSPVEDIEKSIAKAA